MNADIVEQPILEAEHVADLPPGAPVAQESAEIPEKGSATEDFRLGEHIVSHITTFLRMVRLAVMARIYERQLYHSNECILSGKSQTLMKGCQS
ncbi:MAG: hypothetical protein AB7S41_17110 [Parvibaculaceae bacterium]